MTKPLPLWSRNFEASSNINPEVESALSAAAGIALTFVEEIAPWRFTIPSRSRKGSPAFGHQLGGGLLKVRQIFSRKLALIASCHSLIHFQISSNRFPENPLKRA
jgi:hypothetical protein